MSNEIEVCPQCWTENEIELMQCKVCGRYLRTLEDQQEIMEKKLGIKFPEPLKPRDESIPTRANPNPAPVKRIETPRQERESIIRKLFRPEVDEDAPKPKLQLINQGILPRLGAFFIDLLFIGILSFMIPMWISKVAGYSMNEWERIAVAFGVAWLYNVLLLLTGYQATIGQTVFQLVVVNTKGEKISKLQAILRFPAFLISLVTVIGILSIGFTKSKRGWHDLLTGTRVVEKVWMIEDSSGHFIPYESKKRNWFSVLR